ncbi:MAG: flagellar biosynthesis protein FlgN [Treponema sp.]|nr:flagellar biosynthesis protein FlgN [Treponema sp.]MCL2250720.1 flagellar biosynthesis protein FlgN [Treponema sp.]
MPALVKEMSGKTTGNEIDSTELAQRVAVIKRFKTLLTQQRDRFRSYLDLLDKQQGVIESGSADDLLAYVEIEEKIVADIFSIQKVIDPLEEMYYSLSNQRIPLTDNNSSDEVPSLKESLEKLKNEAVVRSTKNKELLSKRMVELRTEITSLRNNPYVSSTKRSSFGTNTSSLVDLQG